MTDQEFFKEVDKELERRSKLPEDERIRKARQAQGFFDRVNSESSVGITVNYPKDKNK